MTLLTSLTPLHTLQGRRHKVFVSYHHVNDQNYRDRFELLFENIFDIIVSKSVQTDDIDVLLDDETIRRKIRDEYLRDSTVTVVLIGTETWKRKHIDWEIGASIRHTKRNPRSGLLGIYLPTYQRKNYFGRYDPSGIPKRLLDNVRCGYASVYPWSENPNDVQNWIHDAFENRNDKNPDNSRRSFSRNI